MIDKQKNKDMQKFLLFIRTLIAFIILFWALFTFIIGIEMTPNGDMSPRIDAGDIMLYYRIAKDANSGDVVALKKNGTDYVGRIAAKGGDTIEITEDADVKINGNVITEDKIYSRTPPYEGFIKYPLTLASDEVFILVDNRNGGEDSRYYGPVKRDEIKGTIIWICRRAGF